MTDGIEVGVDDAAKRVAIGISFSASILDKRNMVLQTHVPLSISDSDLYNIVKKLECVTSRLEAHHEVSKLRKDRDGLINGKRKLSEDIDRLDSQNVVTYNGSSRGDIKQKADADNQKIARENSLASLRRFDEEIARLSNEITVQEYLANGTSGPANSEPSSSDS